MIFPQFTAQMSSRSIEDLGQTDPGLKHNKRKLVQVDLDQTSHVQHEPKKRHARNVSPNCTAKTEAISRNLNQGECHPIKHWVETAAWPARLFKKRFGVSEPQLTRKFFQIAGNATRKTSIQLPLLQHMKRPFSIRPIYI